MKLNNRNGYTVLDYLCSPDRVAMYIELINIAHNCESIHKANSIYKDLKKKAAYIADLLTFKVMTEKSGIVNLLSERQIKSLTNELLVLHEFLEKGVSIAES